MCKMRFELGSDRVPSEFIKRTEYSDVLLGTLFNLVLNSVILHSQMTRSQLILTVQSKKHPHFKVVIES